MGVGVCALCKCWLFSENMVQIMQHNGYKQHKEQITSWKSVAISHIWLATEIQAIYTGGWEGRNSVEYEGCITLGEQD
jgi:hypothetical protein